MKKARIFLFALTVFCFAALAASAQEASNIVKGNLSQTEIDRIIKTFTKNESDFRQALNYYAYNRNATIQTVGMGGQISGVYRRDSFMTFKDDGARVEKISFMPMSTLKDVTISAEDIDNMGGVNPFAIEPAAVGNYNFTYVGKEKIDELNLYVFDVTPKTLPNPRKSMQKYFSGRIWVDDVDLMIVKSKGKALPEGKDMTGQEQRFPIIETWRENVDGKYWFPSLSTANDELVFDSGNSVKLKVRVKYSNYKVGTSDVKILDDDGTEIKEEKKPEDKKPVPAPTPKKP
jgi:hypothetical protein